MEITDFLANDNYIIVNKDLIKKIGLNEAVILGELASEYKNWKSKEKLIDDMFYSTISNIEKNTGLNEYQQRKSFKILKELNLIEYKVKGIPATRYIKINQEQVAKILDIKFFNNLSSSSLKFKELDIENLKGNNNNINNNKNNNNKKEKYFDNKELNDLFIEFLELRKKIKCKNTDRAITLLLNELNKYDDDIKIQMLNNSIMNSWKSVYPVKNKKLPKWFDKEQKIEETKKEDKEELDKILKELENV